MTEQSVWVEDLPILTGTQRQVAWAEDIRRRAIKHTIEDMARYRAVAKRKPGQDHLLPIIEAAYREELVAHTEAKWWIDNQWGFVTLAKRRAKAMITAAQG